MTTTHPGLDVQRLCRLAGLARSSYYRSIADHEDDTRDHAVQEAIQAICLKHKYYGYRRVTAMLRRQDIIVNHKKVLRIMREDKSAKATSLACGNAFTTAPRLSETPTATIFPR